MLISRSALSAMRIAFTLFALVLFSRGYAQFGGLQPVDTIAVDALLVADLDSDGDGDLLATTPHGMIRYRNLDGSGDLGAAEILLSIGMGDHVIAACADLDGDGDNDILFGRASDSSLYCMTNVDGLGNFAAPFLVAALPAPMLPPGSRSVHAADITGDGLPEAIAACAGSTNAFWCAGLGGTFGPLQTIPSLLGGPIGYMDVADLDGDVTLDLLLYDPQGEFVIASNTAGDGSIWDATVIAQTPLDVLRGPDLIDVDTDGDLDIGLHGSMVGTLRNGTAQGLPWPSFSLDVLCEQPEAGEGAYGHIGCGSSASVVHFTSDTIATTRWRHFDPTLNTLGPSLALPDVAPGERALLRDLDGDGLDDLFVISADQFGWYRCELPTSAPAYSITFPPLDTLCQFGGDYLLPYTAPPGGAWSGPWIIDDSFHAGSAWAGSYPIVYQVQDSSLCPVADGTTLHVIEMPIITASEPGPWNCPTGPVQFSAAPSNGLWFGPVDGFGLLDIDTRPFVGELVFVHVDATGASCASVGQVIEVWDIAPMTFLIDTAMCVNDAPQTLVLSGPSPGYVTLAGELDNVVYVQPNVATAQFDPSQGVGTYSIQALASGGDVCPDSIWTTITVFALPELSLTPFDTLCSSSGPYTLDHGSPAGGTWSGFGVFGDVFEVGTPQFGNYILSYAYTDTLGCTANASQVITAISRPSIFGPEDSTVYCTDSGPAGYSASPASGIWSAPLDPSSGILNPAGVQPIPFQGVAQYIYTDPTGGDCVSDPLAFFVLAAPVVTFEIPLDLLFTNSPPIILSGGLPLGGVYTIDGLPVTQFDPALEGPGVFDVYYTASVGPCSKSVADTLLVLLDNAVEEHASGAYRVWPNPATNDLFIMSDLPATGEFCIADVMGRVVLEHDVDRWPMHLDVSVLAPGHYSLLLGDGTIARVLPLVVRR